MTDEEIVALYWRREEDAICETAKRYGTYLTKIALNVLSNVQDSEECVNDTYLRAWNSMPTHRPAVLSVYLGKITRQLSVDLFRRKHAQKRYASEYALCLEELGDTFSDEKHLSMSWTPLCCERPFRNFFGRFPQKRVRCSSAGITILIRSDRLQDTAESQKGQ